MTILHKNLEFLNLKTSKTMYFGCFQGLGVCQNDFSKQKAAYSMSQSLYRYQKRHIFDIFQNHVSTCVMLVYCVYYKYVLYVYVACVCYGYPVYVLQLCIVYYVYVLRLCIQLGVLAMYFLAIFHRCIITTQRATVAMYTRSHTSSTVKQSNVWQKPYELKGRSQSEAI